MPCRDLCKDEIFFVSIYPWLENAPLLLCTGQSMPPYYTLLRCIPDSAISTKSRFVCCLCNTRLICSKWFQTCFGISTQFKLHHDRPVYFMVRCLLWQKAFQIFIIPSVCWFLFLALVDEQKLRWPSTFLRVKCLLSWTLPCTYTAAGAESISDLCNSFCSSLLPPFLLLGNCRRGDYPLRAS